MADMDETQRQAENECNNESFFKRSTKEEGREVWASWKCVDVHRSSLRKIMALWIFLSLFKKSITIRVVKSSKPFITYTASFT